MPAPLCNCNALMPRERQLSLPPPRVMAAGPLRAAFTTMLLLEGTIANSMHPYGVCSGEATINIYRFVDLTDATEDSIASGLAEFAHVAAAALAKRGIGLPGAPLEDEREIA